MSFDGEEDGYSAAISDFTVFSALDGDLEPPPSGKPPLGAAHRASLTTPIKSRGGGVLGGMPRGRTAVAPADDPTLRRPPGSRSGTVVFDGFAPGSDVP